jgi:hypothetical protein
MHVLMLMSDHNSITIDQWITKSLKIDEFKLRLRPKDNSTKSNIYHNKMVQFFILAFSFSKRPFTL